MPKWLTVTLLIVVIFILLIITAAIIANFLFNRKAEKEAAQLLNSHAETKHEIVRKEDLAGLPAPVQKWLEYAKIVGKEKIATVRLKQKGYMRTTEDGKWMPVEAEQYFRVEEPGFIWKANVKMSPLLSLTGLDQYYDGKGRMSIKLLSFIPVVDAKGPEMDESTMLRYLAEMPWFPTAALSSYIKWEPIDAKSAKAIMSYKGVTASTLFTFNEQGDIVNSIAKRYKETNGKFVKEDWGGENKGYREFNGIRIPSKSDIIWYNKTGNFNWFQVEITEIEYNIPVAY